jgi:hypothetical protein
MKKLFTLFLLISTYSIQAQTWDGSASNDWNTAANWSTNTVPIATGNVTIPNVTALPNFPKLASNITLNNLTANTASKIDFNGFKITINVSMDFDGCELNNTKPNTDIVLDLAGTAASILYFRNNLVNDNITINHNSNAILYEAYQGGNIYEQNFILNALGASAFFTCYDTRSEFKGNFSINRSVSGNSNIFRVGNNGVLGDFSYTNNFGGSTIIGELTANSDIIINGKINIECKPNAGNHLFKMYKTKNLTAGGNIDTKNLGHIILSDNNLIVNNLIMNGYASNSLSDFINNTITANVEITELQTNAFYSYFRGNTINGNTFILLNSSNAFYEAYQFGNTFNGNFNMDVAGTGAVFICYDTPSAFNGDVTFYRLGAGSSQIFVVGTTGVSGNFSFTNIASGDLTIGKPNPPQSIINGSLAISLPHTVAGSSFKLKNIKNLTKGTGFCSIQNKGHIELFDNDLNINNLDITGFASNSLSDIKGNTIHGNTYLNEGATNAFYSYLRGNTFDGNFEYIQNSTNILYESYQFSNSYLGNARFERNAGTVSLSYDSPSNFHGDLKLKSASNITFTDNVQFKGVSNGVIEQLGSQAIVIPKLLMDKTVGSTITLNDPIEITNNINLTSGKIKSTATNLLTLAIMATATNFSNSSFVEGPVSKKFSQTEGPFTFPLGAGATIATIAINAMNPLQLQNRQYTADYTPSSANSLYNLTLKDASLDHLSAKEYWNINKVGSFTDATFVTPSWDVARSGGISDLTKLRVARWNGSTWKDEGNSATTGTNTAGTVKTATGINTFSPFTLASTTTANTFTPQNPLPLNLISFTGKNTGQSVELQWTTVNETNFSHFEIERSENAKKFEKIGYANGNKSEYYSYLDTSSPIGSGGAFYRLRLIDFDGKFSFSKIISIFKNDQRLPQEEERLVYPNPVADYFQINNNDKFSQIELLDLRGSSIKKFNYSVDNQYSISGLPKGVYHLQQNIDGKIIITKMAIK